MTHIFVILNYSLCILKNTVLLSIINYDVSMFL